MFKTLNLDQENPAMWTTERKFDDSVRDSLMSSKCLGQYLVHAE